MSDISKIKLPSGSVYNIKDIDARGALEDLVAVHIAGPYDSVEDLPATGEKELLYLVKSSTPSPGILFDEYIWVDLGSEGYEYQKVLFKFDELKSGGSFEWQWTSLTSGSLTWCFGVTADPVSVDLGGVTPSVGMPISLHIVGQNSIQDVSIDETITKNLQFDSTDQYYYLDMSDVFTDYPDPSLIPSNYVPPRIVFFQDGGDILSQLVIWSLCDDVAGYWGNIDTVECVENIEVSALYEQVGHDVSGEIQKLSDKVDQEIDSVYSSIYNRVSKYGDTMYGNLTLNATPTNDKHAVNKKYVDDAVGAVAGLSFMGPYNSFEDLPAQGDGSKIYLVSLNASESNNIYEEYLYINNNYELIGTTEIDLSNYLQPSDLPTYITYTDRARTDSTSNNHIQIGLLSVNNQNSNINAPLEVGYCDSTVNSTLFMPDYVQCTTNNQTGQNTRVVESDWFIFILRLRSTISKVGKYGETLVGSQNNLLETVTLAPGAYVGRVHSQKLEYCILSQEYATKSQVNGKVNTFESEITSQGYQLESYIERMSNSKAVVSISGIKFDTEASTNTYTGNRLLVGYSGIDIQTGTPTSGQQSGLTYTSQISVSPSETVIHNVATPTVSRDAATKDYVDTAISTAIANAISGGY